jgi:hypothetical protein
MQGGCARLCQSPIPQKHLTRLLDELEHCRYLWPDFAVSCWLVILHSAAPENNMIFPEYLRVQTTIDLQSGGRPAIATHSKALLQGENSVTQHTRSVYKKPFFSQIRNSEKWRG